MAEAGVSWKVGGSQMTTRRGGNHLLSKQKVKKEKGGDLFTSDQ